MDHTSLKIRDRDPLKKNNMRKTNYKESKFPLLRQRGCERSLSGLVWEQEN
jgi:hypothetical protein